MHECKATQGMHECKATQGMHECKATQGMHVVEVCGLGYVHLTCVTNIYSSYVTYA